MLKPYYQDDLATIYHGDCQKLVPIIGKVDLVLTDPPYGIGVAEKGTVGTSAKSGHKRTGSGSACTKFNPVTWDKSPPPRWVIDMVISLSKQSIIWGGGHVGGMARAKCWLAWDKKMMVRAFPITSSPGQIFQGLSGCTGIGGVGFCRKT